MLLDPFEKQLNLSALFYKALQYLFADTKRISDLYKRAFELFGVIHDSGKFPEVFLPRLIVGKFNNLVTDDAVS